MEHWAKKFSKTLPQNMFKTRLDTFGTILGIFGTFENFSIFWKHFEDSTLHGTLVKKNFSEKVPQNLFETLLDNLGTILGIFGTFKIIYFFYKNISKTRPSMEHWAKRNFSKKLPQNKFKTRLDTFGNDFGHFWKFWNILNFLKTFRRLDPTWNTGEKKLFWKSTPKLVRNTFGQFRNDFGHFWNF